MDSARRHFEKWEGLGNDFVIVEATPSIDEVRALCDRRRGVGGDGVLVVTPARGGEPARMVVFNADGSRPEMCGNGLRCAAAYLVARGAPRDLVVMTDAGPRRCVVRGDGADVSVEVEMGAARFEEPLVKGFEERAVTFARASVGNPHAITFDQVSPRDHERLGREIEAAVPGGVNVELVTPTADGLRVVVWERGVGFTLACGTGACAVAAVACATGRAQFGEEVRVELPGGPLSIRVERPPSEGARETGPILMTGPARKVFEGAR